jgi:UDP-hydrolysing UDP-N-acetyl-D-glucosamine 2-epimerase
VTAQRFAVLTTGRQDWGILRSTCLELRAHDRVVVLAGGMAVDPRYGQTASAVAGEGLEVIEVPWVLGDGVPHDREAASAMTALGDALRASDPAAVVLVGDRYETAVAALTATLLSIPIVHLHGGEETEGAVDNVLRHSISKLASLHFVSHPEYARRLRQLGEATETIFVSGAPGLDNLHRDDLPTRAELERRLGVSLTAPVVLVTVHPTTLALDPGEDAKAVCAAMANVDATYVITLPNTDTGASAVRSLMESAGTGPRRAVTAALGERGYWGLLRLADAMLGNSSSGLIEAPAVSLPVVNVGDRQAGRLRGSNVIDVAPDPVLVAAALRHALTPAFREQVQHSPALFGDGHAGKRIANHLINWKVPAALRKRFIDYT